MTIIIVESDQYKGFPVVSGHKENQMLHSTRSEVEISPTNTKVSPYFVIRKASLTQTEYGEVSLFNRNNNSTQPGIPK
jgi:hypothetical protein